MKTILRPAPRNILKLFYDRRNEALHLRGIAREAGLNESSASRQLDLLEKDRVLSSERKANLRLFQVKRQIIPLIFPLFDEERLSKLPQLRESAIRTYIKELEHKPILAVVFGSTAEKNAREDSDIDILAVFPGKTGTKNARDSAEYQTGIRIHEFQMTEHEFGKQLEKRDDMVVLSALTSGFPVFNRRYFYEALLNARASPSEALTFH